MNTHYLSNQNDYPVSGDGEMGSVQRCCSGGNTGKRTKSSSHIIRKRKHETELHEHRLEIWAYVSENHLKAVALGTGKRRKGLTTATNLFAHMELVDSLNYK